MGAQQRYGGYNPIGPYQKVRLPSHYPSTPQQHEENIRELERIDWGNAAGTRWATIVIAASDSTDASKATADYVCSAGNAGSVINTAISLLMARTASIPAGRIVLLEGTYPVGTTPIGTSSLSGRSIHIQGMGGIGRSDTIAGTRITTSSGAALAFAGSGAGGGSSVMLSDLQVVTTNATASITLQDIPTIITRCSVVQSGNGGCISQTNTTGASAASMIYDNYIYSTGTGTAIKMDNGAAVDEPNLVADNLIKFGASGTGISGGNNISTTPSYMFVNNYIVGAGTANGTGIQLFGNSVENCTIASNVIKNTNTGILAAGFRHNIVGNLMETVAIGYDSGASNPEYHFVVGNHVTQCSTVAFRFGSAAGTSMKEGTIAFNRISASALTNAIVVGHANCTNCGVFYNDYYGCTNELSDSGTGTRTEGWFLTASMLPHHASTHETGGADPLVNNLDANARVGVRKNSTGSTYKRRRINLIEGTNITVTIADDNTDEEVDVTIAASTGGGSLTVKNNGSTVGAQSTLNFVPGTGITLSGTDTGTQIDLTINATVTAATVSANEYNYFNHR